ncbi:hypothetical protein MPTK1_7g01030 [Marchantia polymorpha subsp. ruderalis]|uniref:Uncharacterized protein n=2 Tax=Marchantia polymorpha TaxID=3197 RepID=A0AAF6BUX4_MARPO|nr:hypothetical protein MARPO_0046s0021 [Marchantia polymorpha]BBN15808.1 hypothetical protein Mp_7g01030 [Marchantia polymorpha subsp. ruderalis]|eukprot:PTQ39198.1 hypothetical protein MARPO_0046s0021 [Marchantia polymorpha]
MSSTRVQACLKLVHGSSKQVTVTSQSSPAEPHQREGRQKAKRLCRTGRRYVYPVRHSNASRLANIWPLRPASRPARQEELFWGSSIGNLRVSMASFVRSAAIGKSGNREIGNRTAKRKLEPVSARLTDSNASGEWNAESQESGHGTGCGD